MASTFYASADGTVFHPVSDEAMACAHDSARARERLKQKLARRKEQQLQDEAKAAGVDLESVDASDAPPPPLPNSNSDATASPTPNANANPNANPNASASASGTETETGNADNADAELALRRIDQRLRSQRDTKAAVAERQHNRGLASDHRFFKGTSKALPSNYVYKPGPAENKHARAIVHHTGSHYVMAGSKQFQRGVRVSE